MKNNILYTIAYPQPNQRFLDINISYTADKYSIESIFQIAAWRPGRYELQNYAKNIRNVNATDSNGMSLAIEKVDRNTWKVIHNNGDTIHISYQYFAMQMDAGGCWVDDNQLYINFICCLLHLKDGKSIPCEVKINVPKDYTLACGLQNIDGLIKATSFYQLADSPMFASLELQKATYYVNDIAFNCWFAGKNNLDMKKLIVDFEKFSKAHLDIFGSFPFEEYHFLIQCLPYPHYHGVEHANSTVIVLEPAETLHEVPMYNELLGIASHELFHAWNACSIRPKELRPYNFSKEQYFESGFVLEGFTTYYGDLLLAKSGVFDTKFYLAQLNSTLKKHFHNFANDNLSLAGSSIDLWVDGYTAGIPDRKVSIYGKGCVVALIIDLTIRINSQHNNSLDDVMKMLWNKFGNNDTGYTVGDVFAIINSVSIVDISALLSECVYGTTNLKSALENVVKEFGLSLVCKTPTETSQAKYGMKLANHSNGFLVDQIVPYSPASKFLSRGDVLVNVYGWSIEEFENHLQKTDYAHITVWRDHRQFLMILQPDGKKYFQWFELKIDTESSILQTNAMEKWLSSLT